MREVGKEETVVVLHDLRVGGGAKCVCQGCWGRFFWLVHLRCGEWRDLRTDVERRDVDALVLWFVVACGGNADDADDVDRRVVGAAGVRGVLESAVALAVAVDAGIDAVGVVGAAGIGGVLESAVALAVAVGAGILVANVAVAVAIAVAVVVECVGLFADDGVDAEVGIVDGGGARGDVDGDADGFVGAAVVVVDVSIEGVGAVDGLEWVAVVVVIDGVRAFAGDGVRTEVKGVRLMMKERSALHCA